MTRTLLRFAPLALALTLSSLAHAAVVGEIKGKVTDESGKPLAGVTVIVTSPALQGEQAEITDVDGYYRITNLQSGTYTVRFFYENVAKPRFERLNVLVSADKMVTVNGKIRVKEAKVETYTITERAPAVDVGTTNVGTTLTAEVVQNIPTGRTYAGVLALTPGSQGDDVGMGFSGATGLENSYLIDGINTTGGQYGAIVSNLPVDFAQEIQILTGGYNAEWGRATGGFVNIITKQGSNQFHGSAWVFTGPFMAAPKEVDLLNQALTTTSNNNTGCAGNQYCLDFGVDVSGPIVKDKLWFYVAFMPQLNWLGWHRSYRMQVDNNGDGVPDDDPSKVACPAYLASKNLCSGKPAPLLEQKIGNSATYQRKTNVYNFQTKLTWRVSPDQDVTFSLFGAPYTRSGVLAGTVSSIDTLDVDLTQANYDAALRWFGKFLNRKLQAEATIAYHREDYNDKPVHPDTSLVQHAPTVSLWDYNTTRDNFPAQCQDAADATFMKCPVQGFNTGGSGYYQKYSINRINAMLRLTGYFRAAGHHAIKLGFDPQFTDFDVTKGYTSGAAYTERLPDARGRGRLLSFRNYATIEPTKVADCPTSQQILYEDNDGNPATACYYDKWKTHSKTVEYASFAQDQWSILPNLTLNVGVRWEGAQVYGDGGLKGIEALNNWAPRIGAVYDPTGEGKSKIFFSYGRFFESMPLDINDRTFSGEGSIYDYWRFPTQQAMYDACGGRGVALNPSLCRPSFQALGSAGTYDATNPYRFMYAGLPGTVTPHIKMQYSDEINVGAQYEVITDLVVGASYRRRWLGAIVEDVSPDLASTFYITNPGFAPPTGQLEKDIAALQNKTDPESVAKLAQLQKLLSDYKEIGKFPKAKRDYNAFEFTVAKRFSKTWYLNASYVYARTIGNYAGLYQATNGQSDPNITSAFDLKYMLLNMSGPLPQDTPHTILVSGYKLWKLGAKQGLVTGLTFRANSGYPINVLGSDPMYGTREVFLLPRGSGGRTPWLYTCDLSLRYQYQLSKTMQLTVSFDLFNLFDLRQTTAVDELYTESDAFSINHGRIADLRHLKDTTNTPVSLYFNYGNSQGYQNPLSGRFGLRLTF
jgi:hypothetical protein